MTGFFIAAAAMVAVALAFLVPPLMRGASARAAPSRRDAGLAVHRERVRELEAERDAGEIDAEAFRVARDELDRELLAELDAAPTEPGGAARARPWAALLMAVALPLTAGVAYLLLGAPDLLLPGAAAPPPQAAGAPDVDEMVARVEQHLERNPDDARGWLVLGRSYQLMGRLEDARRALERAVRLAPENAEALVSLAETLAGAAGGSLAGEPLRLVERALAVEPQLPRALWLAGIHAFHSGDSKQAMAHWRQALASPELDPRAREQIRAAIASAGGGAPPGPSGAPPAAPASVQVQVSLAPELAARLRGGETLFVFARAPGGPPLPLAVKRFGADRLPLTVTLDESDAMTPQHSLAGTDTVVVTARISRSGDPMAAPGDLEGDSAPVATRGGAPVSVVVDREVPPAR